MRSQDWRVGSGEDPRALGSRRPPPSSRELRKKEPLRDVRSARPRGSSDRLRPSTMAAKPPSSLALSFFFSLDLCSARSKLNLRRGLKDRSMV